MTTGAGIAIAGMWLAVGITGYRNGIAAVLLGFFAAMATMGIAGVK